jgi:hypothetical protein
VTMGLRMEAAAMSHRKKMPGGPLFPIDIAFRKLRLLLLRIEEKTNRSKKDL